MGVSLVGSIVIVVGLLGLVGLAAYAVVRARGEQPVQLTLPVFLAGYVHVAALAGLIVLAVGMVQVVNAGLSRTAGSEFSYGRQMGRAVAPPLEPSREADGAPEDDEARAAESEAREAQRLDEEFRAGLPRGIALAIAGALIYGIHIAARRTLGAWGSAREIRLVYLGALLAVFGLVSVISIPIAISSTLDFVVQTSPEYFRGPGEDLAMAIVFTPIWLGLMARLLREVRRRGRIAAIEN